MKTIFHFLSHLIVHLWNIRTGEQAFAQRTVFTNAENIVTAVNGSKAELDCQLNIDLDSSEMDNVTWVRAPRQILTRGIFRVTEDPRISTAPLVLLKRRDFSLFIHPVLFEDAGEYRCAITLKNNVYIRTVTLKVLLPPKITRSPVPFLKVDEGASLEITCAAKGYPNPQTKWFVSKRSPNMFARPDQRNQTFQDLIPVTEKFSDFAGQILSLNGTLWITKLHRNMNGYLVCVAQNGVLPDDTTTLELSVRFPPDIQMANRVIKQSLGMNTVLSCTVFANPPGTVQWYFNQKTRIIASSCDILSNEEKKHCLLEHRPHPNNVLAPIISKLTIFKLNPADFGDYTCSVSNIMGERHGTTSLQRITESYQLLAKRPQLENPTVEGQHISATKPVPISFTKASVQRKLGQVKNLAWKQHTNLHRSSRNKASISAMNRSVYLLYLTILCIKL